MEWWVWLVIAAAVVLPLGLLGLVGSVLRRRLAELNRVAALATEQAQSGLTDLNRRSATMQERLATLRTSLPASSGAIMNREPGS